MKKTFLTTKKIFYFFISVCLIAWYSCKKVKKEKVLVNNEPLFFNIDSVQVIDTAVTVYNLEVEGNHNYFVGEKGVLVHNINCNLLDDIIIKHKKLIENNPQFLTNPRELGIELRNEIPDLIKTDPKLSPLWKKYTELYSLAEKLETDPVKYLQELKQTHPEFIALYSESDNLANSMANLSVKLRAIALNAYSQVTEAVGAEIMERFKQEAVKKTTGVYR